MTLVFCDVAGSTPLGERLDPEALRGVWSRYHETAREVLERHGGTIEKFVGDAVMAAFGIPVVHEDDALRAVRAAAELREELAALNDELDREFGVRIEVRTGVNTGEVFAGDPAEGDPFATGDAVVVASRLEAAATAGEILVGEATMRLVRHAVEAEPAGEFELKGKSAPQRAWRLVSVAPEAAALERRLDAPLVGRARELALLRAELDGAIAERACRIVTIVGEPGIGKSRLAAELGASAADVHVLEGRCLPYGNGVTYWPLVEIVARLDLDELLRGAPDGELVHGRIREATGQDEPRSRSDELYWAVRRLLETLARERPVILILDDVQWAEPAFLDLVEYLAGWSRDAPILICCLARPDLLDARPTWRATVELAPLTADDAQALLENLGGPLDAAAAAAVGRATGGNPLFLEEMLRMLLEDGVLVSHAGRLEPIAAVDDLRVPATVQAVLAARLDHLDAPELALLQRAAVIGQVFWWGAVADLSPQEEVGDVAARLQALVRKGLIRPDRRTFAGEDGFRFGHILIRDAAYDSTSKRLRAELHERFADWVDGRVEGGGELDEILGHHLERAHAYGAAFGPPDEALAERAAAALGRAGRRALAREDPHAAATLLGRAVELTLSSNPERPATQLDHAVALHRAGAIAVARERIEELLAAPLPPRVAASARLERAFILVSAGEGTPDEVLTAAEESTPVFAELRDESGLAQVWNAVATELFWRGKVRQMEAAAARALDHARRGGDTRQELGALNGLCIALAFGPAHADAAARRCSELIDRAADLGSATLARFALAGIEAMRGNASLAWEHYDRAKDGAGRPGVLLYAEPLLMLEPARGEAELRHAYVELERLGEVSVLPTAAAFLAELLLNAGNRTEADELSGVARRLSVSSDVFSQVLWRRVRARLETGAVAAELAASAVALARETDSPHLLAGTLAAVGDPGEAIAVYHGKGNVAAAAALDVPSETR